MKSYSSKATINWLCLTVLFAYLCSFGCKKLMEVDPPVDQVIGKEIFNSNLTAPSVLTGIYSDMVNYSIFNGSNSISMYNGLSADELIPTTLPSEIHSILYTNSLTNNGDRLFWSNLYSFIFKANSAIEGLSASTGISQQVRDQLIGEAKFIRAFMYFYLVTMYGDVPILTSTDIRINSTAARADKDLVYRQIVDDLKDAQKLLNASYVSANAITVTEERLRPNLYVATALLARVYLYTQQWNLAENEATTVINQHSLFRLESLDNVFLKSSKEAIWQLQPINLGQNTLEAEAFVLDSGIYSIPAGPNGANRPVYLSKQVYNAFEPGDKRKNHWLDSVEVNGIVYPYPFKYKAWQPGAERTEYLVVLRLAEQYLIRSEARLRLGKITGGNSAMEDINIIRSRAELTAKQIQNKEDVLDEILSQRRVELFAEWGHRWLDLKRIGKIDEVMNKICPIKGGVWSSYKALYPIPTQDIQRNTNLKGHQNNGYPEI